MGVIYFIVCGVLIIFLIVSFIKYNFSQNKENKQTVKSPKEEYYNETDNTLNALEMYCLVVAPEIEKQLQEEAEKNLDEDDIRYNIY